MYHVFSLQNVHPSWHDIIKYALHTVSEYYLQELTDQPKGSWLPGAAAIFNAFSIPLTATRYVLLGESPYPRAQSANGYAFWDHAIGSLWSSTGFSKELNRATSWRNFIKMLLVAQKLIRPDELSQANIARLDKSSLITDNRELFERLLKEGFLLLNASLVFRPRLVNTDAKHWQPFLESILHTLENTHPRLNYCLFGKIAQKIKLLTNKTSGQLLISEHPYNLSFITNREVIDFFEPLRLLNKCETTP